MYVPTPTPKQLNLFSSPSSFLSGRSQNIYLDETAWHNQFRTQVIMRIDENIFSPLFCKDNGAPNASIRVLIGMMILKEAQGWSDSHLFEQCLFNILTRSALGLLSLDDPLPASSTYYLLRKRIVEWEKEGHENLIETVFSQVTKGQAYDFEINGKKIRMDSKLIGSNIAWYSRYELIHETLRLAYSQIKQLGIDQSLTAKEVSLLESIIPETGNKVCYRSSKEELSSQMEQLGALIYRILKLVGESKCTHIQTLGRVFGEQYQVVESDKPDESPVMLVVARPKEDIAATSVQSPHDTQCTYRNKDGNQKKGYSVNVTETCDNTDPKDVNNTDDTHHAPALNLVTHVQVDVVSTADNSFLQSAIERTQEVVPQKVETVYTDGAYHSIDNQEFCQGEDIELKLGAIQGKSSRYDLSVNQDNDLVVTDTETAAIVPVRKLISRKDPSQVKWAIKNDKGKDRYFTQKEIDTCNLRKQLSAIPQSELNTRNNVEATIFQLGYRYPNDKSRYRGLVKHKIWANIRCLWVNFVRIVNYVNKINQKDKQNTPVFAYLYQFLIKHTQNIFKPPIWASFDSSLMNVLNIRLWTT